MRFDIRAVVETDSTNTDAILAAEAGAAEGTVIWALRQRAGRGRQGRQWVAPEGNLYCTLILRPPCPPQDYGRFSFVAALATGDMLATFLPDAKIELKWPNDVLINGKKISGILLEAGEGWLVAGIGLNILHYPENPLYPVTSLAAEIPDPPPTRAVLDALLANFAGWYETLNQSGFAPLRAAWLARARKGDMRVRLPDGDIHGTFADLDENGNLCLELAGGKHQKFSTGDVFF